MKKRSFGIRAEFAVMPENKSSEIKGDILFNRLKESISGMCSIHCPTNMNTGFYVENGSSVKCIIKNGAFRKFNLVETDLKECYSPAEVVTYQRSIENMIASSGRFFKCSYDIMSNPYNLIEYYNLKGCGSLKKILISHLITRIIYTGAGTFNERGEFLISSAAEKYELSSSIDDFFNRPSIFKRVTDFLGFYFKKNQEIQKLDISFSDPNMCQTSEYMKFGTTALVIQLIESGEDLRGVIFQDSLASLKHLNRDLFFDRKYRMSDGSFKSVLQVQQEFYDRIKSFLKREKITFIWSMDILEKWKMILNIFEKGEHKELSGILDWPSKLDLMITASSGQSVFRIKQYLPVIEFIESLDINSTLFVMPPERIPGAGTIKKEIAQQIELMCRQNHLESENISRMARAFYACRKVDISFHDISSDTGYQRGLEAEGYFDTFISPDDISRAINTNKNNTN